MLDCVVNKQTVLINTCLVGYGANQFVMCLIGKAEHHLNGPHLTC